MSPGYERAHNQAEGRQPVARLSLLGAALLGLPWILSGARWIAQLVVG